MKKLKLLSLSLVVCMVSSLIPLELSSYQQNDPPLIRKRIFDDDGYFVCFCYESGWRCACNETIEPPQ